MQEKPKPQASPAKGTPIRIKAKDEVLGGVYANTMIVAHTKEEFVLDFLAVFPPQGILNSRVIISPGHLKRLIRALQENLGKYESKFGTIQEATSPDEGGAPQIQA
jgi:hypothetical protein